MYYTVHCIRCTQGLRTASEAFFLLTSFMTTAIKTDIKIVMSLSGQFWTLLQLKADPFIFHVTSKRISIGHIRRKYSCFPPPPQAMMSRTMFMQYESSSNCQPSLMRCPENGTEVGVRYGKSDHRNHISDQEKHHLHH